MRHVDGRLSDRRRLRPVVQEYALGLRWFVVDADGIHYSMPWSVAESPKVGEVRRFLAGCGLTYETR